jgi:cation:H+ antiporter
LRFGAPVHLDFSSFHPAVNAIVVVVTIALIALGANWVVESAGALAKKLGISELVIGLTVVAFATSAPELAVTLLAAFEGKEDISVANIVGSNIFNLGFILGGAACIRAVATDRALVYRDAGLLLLTTFALVGLIGWDLKLGRLDGALLFSVLTVYLLYLYLNRHAPPGEAEEIDTSRAVWIDAVLLVGGLIAIVGGSHLMVGAASALAKSFGVSDWVIGVTIVAAGTSAPEMATTFVGIVRNRHGLAAGNVIGSDLFNMLGVLGVAGMVHPVSVDISARGSLFSLAGFVALVFIFLRTGFRLRRSEGAILVGIGLVRWIVDFSSHGG